MPQQNVIDDAKITSAGSGSRPVYGDPLLAEVPQPDRAFSRGSGDPKWHMLGRRVRLAQVGCRWR
jgi:hypothetical protein